MSRKRQILALAGVVAMVALVLPATFASADPSDANTVRLHMASGTDYFKYTNADGSVVKTQTLSAKSCALRPSVDAIVSLLGSPPTPASASTVGLSSDQLGVKSNGEGSSGKCAQVNIPDQILTMKVNPAGVLVGKSFDFAELDIEAKYNATINIALYNKGTQVDADPLAEGFDFTKNCTTSGSDCGPDSADHDNFRIRIPTIGTVQFDELRLWATTSDSQGSVALEGGRDGTPALPTGLGATIGTTDSIFHVSAVLDCGDTKTASSQGLASVTVTRHNNTGDPTGANCVEKNYVLTTTMASPPGDGDDTNVITFDQETVTGQEGAHYTMEIHWTYEPVTDSTSTNPAAVGGRTFYIDVGDGSGPQEAELCPVVGYDSNGDPVTGMHPEDPDLPWCITGQSYTIDAAGDIVLTQAWDGIGDPKMW